jgi:hypothetical protein
MMRRRLVAVLLIVCSGVLTGCASNTPTPFVPSCTGLSTTALTNYDQVSATLLNETTRHPTTNVDGEVVWGTRYYMESLLTAYQATGNLKYIQAFLDTGTAVLNLVKTIPVVNTDDPTRPGATGPTVYETGWPTQLGAFAAPVPLPTADGKISMYAQSLTPNGGAEDFQVTQQADGSLQLAWLDGNNLPLQTYTVKTLSDLQALGTQPLVWGQSLGRIIPTGAGLPTPGLYLRGPGEETVWHEQTGGILLPFVQFLLLAKEHPEIADSNSLEQWTTTVLSIASGYENEFVPDSAGGLRFVNPRWLPNPLADTDAAADYIFVEAELRLLLYELTDDPHQLELAKGLAVHQQTFHWRITSDGWLELKGWPCIVPWSNRAGAPTGSIWDVFQYDPDTPAPSTDASFVTDFLDAAFKYDMISRLGVSSTSFDAQQAAFMNYMVGGITLPFAGPNGIMRSSFPTASSTIYDPLSYSADPWAAAAWAPPELSGQIFTNANWNWMLQYGQPKQGYPVGYFLRSWARSEAAQMTICAAQKKATSH